MQAYSCMLCRKTDRDFINICYRNGRNSAKDDILEICGNSVAQYLENDDLVCSRCITVLDRAASVKREIYDTILDYRTNRSNDPNMKGPKMLQLSNYYSDYEDSEEECESSTNLSRTSPRNVLTPSSPSPNNYMGASPDNLLMIKQTIAYEDRPDTDMEIANNKYRYYERATPILDREVQRVNFRGRRKTRGHNWTRRKGSQRSRSHSHARSSNYSRYSRSTAHSRSSRGTTASKKHQIQEQGQSLQNQRILSDFLAQDDSLAQFTRAYLIRKGEFLTDIDMDDDDDDYNVTGYKKKKKRRGRVIKTRYASELRDKLLQEYDRIIYECPYKSCNEVLFNLEQITEHRVKEHNEMALFWCEQCKFSYLSQEHLEKHKEKHFLTFLSYCIYCSEEFTNKRLYEEHLNEHLIHSFPCIYCDKFFLRKQICDNHIREAHPGRKKKIKRIKPQSILDRIDKYPGRTDELDNWKSGNSSQEFVVKVLWQHGHVEDSTINNEEDLVEESNNEDFMSMCEGNALDE